MADSKDTVNDCKELVKQFCDDRDWTQFHLPKDLAIGMVTEASELLEIFRFKSDAECKSIIADPDRKEHIEEELADVYYFLLRFAQLYDFDLSDILREKIRKNSEKYPVELSKGSNKKYNEF